MFDEARNRVILALISGFFVCVARKSFLKTLRFMQKPKI